MDPSGLNKVREGNIPSKSSEAVLFIVLIFPFVGPPVLPGEHSLAVHFVIQPASDVFPLIRPDISTFEKSKKSKKGKFNRIWDLTDTADIVFEELSLVHAAISPFEDPVAVLQTIKVHSLVDTPVVPGLLPEPALDIVLPIPLVSGPVSVLEGPLALGFIVRPIPEVNMPLGVDQPSLPVAFVSLPVPLIRVKQLLTFINTPVRPDLGAESVSLSLAELPLVRRPVLEFVWPEIRERLELGV